MSTGDGVPQDRVRQVTIYADSTVYDLGDRTVHDYRGGGTIDRASGDKVCHQYRLSSHPNACRVQTLPSPSDNDAATVDRFTTAQPQFVSQITQQARTASFSDWDQTGSGWMATATTSTGTLQISDRNGDCKVDKLVLVPDAGADGSLLTTGLRLYRDNYDEVFDFDSENRPAAQPLAVSYLDKIKPQTCPPK